MTVTEAYSSRPTVSGFSGLPPVLASARGLWRTEALPSNWTASYGVPNEGTGGSSYNLTVASQAPTLPFTNHATSPGDGNRVTPTLVSNPRGLSIGLGIGTTDNIGADYGLFTTAAFDLSGSASFLIDFTPNNTGVTFTYFARQGSGFGENGWHIEEAQAFGGFISYVGDKENFVFNPPTIEGLGAQTAAMVTGRQQYLFVIDRSTNTYRCYRNGALLPSSGGSDISTMGDATDSLPLVFGANFVLHNAAFWPRALTTTEATSTLPRELGLA